MKFASKWTRRTVIWSAAGALALASIVATSAADAAHTTAGSRAAASAGGPGYPPPKGIYAPFTDCPLLNPLMQESTPGSATGCVTGDVVKGEIKIGNVTTKIKASVNVKYPVTVQFGIWDPPNATPSQWIGGVLPPPVGGLSAQLTSTPQFVRGGLLKALGCPNANATVETICKEAQAKRGKDLKVFAAAVSAGPITGFNLTTWFQPVMFQLINPLLGNSCYIGSTDNPVMLNPQLTAGSGGLVEEMDPHPKYHPDTAVLVIPGATAADTTFTAPPVQGCGPGGTANIAVDEAIDTAVGLPTASGADSISLTGTFYLAANYAPANMAKILLSAFRASARSGGTATVQRISRADLREIGIKLTH